MTTLYTLTGQYLALQDLDMPDEDLADSLEAITGEIDLKAESISHVLANLDTSPIDTEIKRLQNMKRVYTNRAAALKSYLRDNMMARDINGIQVLSHCVKRLRLSRLTILLPYLLTTSARQSPLIKRLSSAT